MSEGSLNEYRIVERLSAGSFGSVFRIIRNSDDREFVLKRVPLTDLDAPARSQAKLEVDLMRQLHHPHIVSYRDAFLFNDEDLCIVMDWYGGGDLEGVLKRQHRGRVTEQEAMLWLVEMALALHYLHSHRIVHRDLKLQNVFMDHNTGEVALGDFGVAKLFEGMHPNKSTAPSGTPLYMAPEVLQGRPASFKSDVWSMGCILYEMLCGRHPFEATDISGLVINVVRGEFSPIPSDYSTEAAKLVARMLERDERRRPNVDEILMTPFVKTHVHNYMAVRTPKGPATGQSESILRNQIQVLGIHQDEVVDVQSTLEQTQGFGGGAGHAAPTGARRASQQQRAVKGRRAIRPPQSITPSSAIETPSYPSSTPVEMDAPQMRMGTPRQQPMIPDSAPRTPPQQYGGAGGLARNSPAPVLQPQSRYADGDLETDRRRRKQQEELLYAAARERDEAFVREKMARHRMIYGSPVSHQPTHARTPSPSPSKAQFGRDDRETPPPHALNPQVLGGSHPAISPSRGLSFSFDPNNGNGMGRPPVLGFAKQKGAAAEPAVNSHRIEELQSEVQHYRKMLADQVVQLNELRQSLNGPGMQQPDSQQYQQDAGRGGAAAAGRRANRGGYSTGSFARDNLREICVSALGEEVFAAVYEYYRSHPINKRSAEEVRRIVPNASAWHALPNVEELLAMDRAH